LLAMPLPRLLSNGSRWWVNFAESGALHLDSEPRSSALMMATLAATKPAPNRSRG
jgi:hypothetical protein